MQAHENKLARLIEQLEEANILLQRAAHTADELSKLFRVTLNDNWPMPVEGKHGQAPV